MLQADEKVISLTRYDAGLIRQALLIGLECLAEVEILDDVAHQEAKCGRVANRPPVHPTGCVGDARKFAQALQLLEVQS